MIKAGREELNSAFALCAKQYMKLCPLKSLKVFSLLCWVKVFSYV